jgi:hypothetical protein
VWSCLCSYSFRNVWLKPSMQKSKYSHLCVLNTNIWICGILLQQDHKVITFGFSDKLNFAMATNWIGFRLFPFPFYIELSLENFKFMALTEEWLQCFFSNYIINSKLHYFQEIKSTFTSAHFHCEEKISVFMERKSFHNPLLLISRSTLFSNNSPWTIAS